MSNRKGGSDEWVAVDTKQRKGEKRKEREAAHKRTRQQIELEREERRKADEKLSYSGWGPKDDPNDPHNKKNKKKPSSSSSSSTASSSKRAAAAAPPQGSFGAKTIYAALTAEEDRERAEQRAAQKRAAATEAKRAAAAAAAADAQAAQKRKEQARKKKLKAKKTSVAQLSATLDLATMKPFLQELTEKYSTKYDVQLLVLADFFESRFGKASLGPAKLLEEKTFARKLEIPYVYLDEEVGEALEEWLGQLPEMPQTVFTQFLLKEIANAEKNHKTSGIGLRMLLSAIVRSSRSVASASTERPEFIQKYLTDSMPASVAPISQEEKLVLREAYFSHIVWFLGQTIEDHPTLAFSCMPNCLLMLDNGVADILKSVWVKFLQPWLFLSAPDNFRTTVIEFFNLLFANNGINVKHAEPSDAFLALDRLATYRESHTESELKKDPLNAIFLAIENSIVWCNPSSAHNYLAIYLRHCKSESKFIREESQKKVIRVLLADRQNSLEEWKRLYPRYISESSNVVYFLNERWDKYVSRQDKSLLSETSMSELISHFLRVNHKFARSGYKHVSKFDGVKTTIKVHKSDVDANSAACKDLMQKTGLEVTTPDGATRKDAERKVPQGSSPTSGILGTLVYFLLFVSLVAAIGVLYLRQSKPETYEQLLRVGREYYHQGKAQAYIWSAEATVQIHQLLAKADALKHHLIAVVSSKV